MSEENTTETTETEPVAEKAAPKKKAAPKAEKKSSPAKYVNKSTRNLFTEAGRCMPGQTVELMPEQAIKYEGLEECQ